MTTPKTAHSPLPWKSHGPHIWSPEGKANVASVSDPYSSPAIGYNVCHIDSPYLEVAAANAAYIVQAANAYPALVEALEEIASALVVHSSYDPDRRQVLYFTDERVQQVHKVLAAAKGDA